MKPFSPARIVGGSIVAEREPYAFEATASYRAVQITELADHGPAHREAPRLEVERVVVREPHEYVASSDHFIALFQRSAVELAAFDGTPAPRLLHTFGRRDRILAIVIEHIAGVSLARVLEALQARRALLSVEVALAIASELVPLWRVPSERGAPVALHLGRDQVWITTAGRVRATPELANERARQIVGAAASLFAGNVAYLAPEEVDGTPCAESGMFTLGLLLDEMLTAAHPLAELSMFELLSQLRNEDLPPIASRRALPREVAAFVSQTTARDPRRRWPSWAALAHALAALRGGLPPVDAFAVLAALPPEARPLPEPPIERSTLVGWRGLPNDGLVPVSPDLPVPRPAPPRAPARIAADLVYAGNDQRPMLAVGRLLIDLRPVTAAEFQRFVLAMAAGALEPTNAADTPRTQVSFEQAAAYAAWAGKRLPTDGEWTAAVTALGADRLATGQIWEWTVTRAHDGRVVRGGRWRNDLARPAAPDNSSFETAPADDLGFRCLCDLDDRAS
jgi:Sulfatase-modifying factor enzyme 1